ncbi:MAG TPA: bifunctional UDP-N-acetylglucosamine diphosphorylase/glucosamine-1-phosphate N-acetyltransferase GlmU [Methylomirabilota bacterium]|jgi:bifunctional UDP-N-acetylglucosamine pyrophosphorylase/glucosamine-1-phosphate N-acetyltransferase|nr:bifunctional UDP-N-acetylglucosamine diphosphorylase/glucosamine-1-phosphate N-acetyltransferase GlmU [Methylomirabilota bacterium]
MDKLTAIILAAGEATRMRSRRPKVLHALCGRALIDYPVTACRALGARLVVVVGRDAEQVQAAVGRDADVTFVEQRARLGTGHAVLQAREACVEKTAGAILVLPGDMPLLSQDTLRRLVEHHGETKAAVTLLTVEADDPTGYGRVVRENGKPVAIVEHRDATAAQRAIREIGTSTYCFDPRHLWSALERLTPRNQQGEYYLTDVVDILSRDGQVVEAVIAEDPREGLGVNDRRQLAELAAVMRRHILDRLMLDGVSVLDPASTYVDDTVEVGADTVLYPGVILEGRTRIGAQCVIGPGSSVSHSRLGDRVTLRPYCVLAEAVVEDAATLGPFCHLRPLSHVGAGAKIGNFVELKKSRIGRGAKVPHLSYVGDATLGEDVNVGAGAITCNYDGVAKHETKIGAGAFIGTNASLVAPITVGEGAYVGAGSVITKDVPPGALAVTRAQQTVREGWVAKRRKPRKARDGE